MNANATGNELKWLRVPALPGVELIRARALNNAPTAILGQLVLVRCDRGTADLRWGERAGLLLPGAALVQPAEAPPAVLRPSMPELEYRVVRIDPARLLPSTSQGAPLVTAAPPVVEAVDALFAAVEQHADALAQRTALQRLLGEALARSRSEQRILLTPPIARARERLQTHYAESVQLRELAALVGMSKCHLVHLFHKEVGLPPHAYLIHVRVAHARILVAAGVPLTEVAMRAGFADQSHLTRRFKRVVGLPPGQFAALCAATAPVEVSPSREPRSQYNG
jgi:AraC-like DNA-binding protein